MAFTVGELARLSGVTVRTLHHYDEIGLVRPSGRTAAGYRLYGEQDVLRLHQVLLFRDIGMALDEIARAIENVESQGELLRHHREVLLIRRARFDAMLASVDARLAILDREQKGMNMTPDEVGSLFSGFDPAPYEEEAKARWGDSDAYQESARRTKGYGKADWQQYRREASAIDGNLILLMQANTKVTDRAVQAAVEEHRLLIDRWFYPCSVAMHKNLGAMYVTDERFTANLNKIASGYAQYLSGAIAAS